MDIRHDPAAGVFSAEVEGHPARLAYTRDGGVMVVTSTRVPPEIGGRGIAARLVEAALAHARAEGLRVEPRCSYVAAWFERHPEHAALRA